MTSPVWTFQQLSDPKTTLTLPGWQAPFGRPRNGAIFNAGLKINKQRTNYPGVNVPPTIHKFGTELKPIEKVVSFYDYCACGISVLAPRVIDNLDR